MVELAGCAGCAEFDELLLMEPRWGCHFYRLWKFATIISRCLNYNRRHSSLSNHLRAASFRCFWQDGQREIATNLTLFHL